MRTSHPGSVSTFFVASFACLAPTAVEVDKNYSTTTSPLSKTLHADGFYKFVTTQLQWVLLLPLFA